MDSCEKYSYLYTPQTCIQLDQAVKLLAWSCPPRIPTRTPTIPTQVSRFFFSPYRYMAE